ncbi:hypothetical protein [Frigidibacter sp. MR17.24]|uniref:hypothetical protein n=1 Tax=Frigidibacter sp. MR17.24 TaxID=3127345 RepID=UPI003012BE83
MAVTTPDKKARWGFTGSEKEIKVGAPEKKGKRTSAKATEASTDTTTETKDT